MFDTCTLAVLVLMNKALPISPLDRPAATNSRTSTSRGVRPLIGLSDRFDCRGEAGPLAQRREPLDQQSRAQIQRLGRRRRQHRLGLGAVAARHQVLGQPQSRVRTQVGRTGLLVQALDSGSPAIGAVGQLGLDDRQPEAAGC